MPFDINRYVENDELNYTDEQEKQENIKLFKSVIHSFVNNLLVIFVFYLPIYFILLCLFKLIIICKIFFFIGLLLAILNVLPVLFTVIFLPMDLFKLITNKSERKKGIGFIVTAEIIRLIDLFIDVIILIWLFIITFRR